MKNIKWKYPWLIKWLPLPGILISALGLAVIMWAPNGTLMKPPLGWLITTGHWHFNIIWQSCSALFWSASGMHWFSNTLLILLVSALMSNSQLGWLDQWVVFLSGGWLANLLFAILFTVLNLHAVVIGASPGIMAMVGANIINIILELFRHYVHTQIKPLGIKHVFIKFVLSIGFGWIVILCAPFSVLNSGGLHLLGLLSGMVIMAVMEHYHFYRA